MSRSDKKQQVAPGHWTCLAVALVALSSCQLVVRCQFLQPQSHLGRLVQSITSPLVLSSNFGGGGGGGESDPSAYDSESSGPSEPSAANLHQQPSATHQRQPAYYRHEGAGQHFQHYAPQQQSRGQMQRGQKQAAGLQQAPSQQRGVPQHFYNENSQNDNSQNDDEDSGAPTNHHKQQAADEQYRMGAYLGPTIDDKEIQGAFNSNDDKDDDESAGYEGPPSSGGRGRGANAFAASQPDASGFSPAGGDASGFGPSGFGPSAADSGRAGRNGDSANFDDELGADEDDEPAARPAGRRQPRFRSSSSMSQAAASHHQQRQPGGQSGAVPQQQQRQHAGMVAAANGYSPIGTGPFDLSGLMGAVNGQAYEVYQGDGSYPGQGYYQAQQQQGQGRRNQAASMQYGNNPYGQQANGNGGRSRNADADDDQDED